jgi:hypothetical protein
VKLLDDISKHILICLQYLLFHFVRSNGEEQWKGVSREGRGKIQEESDSMPKMVPPSHMWCSWREREEFFFKDTKKTFLFVERQLKYGDDAETGFRLARLLVVYGEVRECGGLEDGAYLFFLVSMEGEK